MKTHLLKRILVLLAFLPIILSCSKDESGSEPINIDAGIVSNSQVAEITIEAEELNQNIYDGTINGIPIKAVKSQDNELSFFIPNDLPTGIYSVLIPTLNATINVEVVATILNVSADETMSDFFTNITTYSQTIDTSTPQGADIALSITSFSNFYNNSDQEMKDAIAVIYKANKTKFDNFFLNIDSGRSTTSIFSDFFSNNKKAVYKIGLGAVLVVAAPVLGGATAVAAGVMGVLIAKKGCEEAYRSNALLIDNVYDDIKVKVSGFFGTNNRANENVVLTDNVAKEVTFQLSRRKIIASDENKTTPLALEYFDSYNRYNEFSERINQTIDDLNNSNTINYGDVSLETLPTASPEVAVNVSSELFDNVDFTVNNSNITLEQANFLSDGQLNLKAKLIGNVTSASVSSDLNYSYNNGFSDFSGKISLRVERSIVGTWQLESFENGVPVGQYKDLYTLAACPSIVTQKYTYISDVIVFTPGTYSENSVIRYVYLNKTILTANCVVDSDSPDTIEDFNDVTNGNYIINENNIEIYPSDGDDVVLPITFLNNNKIKIGDIVLVRQ